jgi:ferredoxin
VPADLQQQVVRAVVAADGLQALLQALRRRGFRTIGPTLRDRAIVYDDIDGIEDLPRGWGDEQQPGHYRVVRRDDGALFGYVVGPQSWKRFLHPPHLRLWQAERRDGAVRIVPEAAGGERFAFIGVRGCELAAIAIQDRVFLGGDHRDSHYAARRDGAFILAVNCGTAAATCFCTSMGSGPAAGPGYDLVLTELIGEGRHEFLLETGSAAGHALLGEVPHRAAAAADLDLAATVVARTAASIQRELPAQAAHDLLLGNLEHPRWDEVAARCLSCANCTMVCPTCFCSTVEDSSDLSGDHAERWRRWDSCFTTDFSYIHGGSVRPTTRSSYRQWMTHKLATWVDQFGSSGCVGCGRCIAWCPVGIDITEEVRAIQQADGAREAST